MNIIKFIILYCSVFLIACNGASNSTSQNGVSDPISKYAGNWHYKEANTYLQIQSNSNITIRRCSINNGYVADKNLTASINNDTLTIIDGKLKRTSTLSMIDNKLIETYTDGSTVQWLKHNNIPESCVNNSTSDPTSKYAGNWYYTESDRYLHIQNNGTITIRRCSINNGYVAIKYLTASINNDTLTVTDGKTKTTSTLSIIDNKLIEKYTDGSTDQWLKHNKYSRKLR